MTKKISKAEIDLIVLIKSATTTTDRRKRNKEERQASLGPITDLDLVSKVKIHEV